MGLKVFVGEMFVEIRSSHAPSTSHRLHIVDYDFMGGDADVLAFATTERGVDDLELSPTYPMPLNPQGSKVTERVCSRERIERRQGASNSTTVVALIEGEDDDSHCENHSVHRCELMIYMRSALCCTMRSFFFFSYRTSFPIRHYTTAARTMEKDEIYGEMLHYCLFLMTP